MTYFIIAAVAVILSIVGSMWFFSYLANKYMERQREKRLRAIDEASPYKPNAKKPGPIKLTDELKSKDRGLEKIKKEQQESAVTRYNPNEQEVSSPNKEREEEVIVGVAKPVGMWSKFIMKQKLGFILALGGLQSGQDKGSKGYWQNLIKAQGFSQGKDQGRGR